MNIFVLDKDMKKSAEYTCDKHVIKMTLEHLQLLCSAYYYTGQEHLSPYGLTHKNHPMAIWVRESLSNWIWLRDYNLVMNEEYKYRYGKDHACGILTKNLITPNLKDIGLTNIPLCMPEEYRVENDPVQSYRNFYIYEKITFATYRKRKWPDWLEPFRNVKRVHLKSNNFTEDEIKQLEQRNGDFIKKIYPIIYDDLQLAKKFHQDRSNKVYYKFPQLQISVEDLIFIYSILFDYNAKNMKILSILRDIERALRDNY